MKLGEGEASCRDDSASGPGPAPGYAISLRRAVLPVVFRPARAAVGGLSLSAPSMARALGL